MPKSSSALCARCGAELSLPLPSICFRCEGPPLLDGRYALLEILGRSAERTTYRARRLEDGVDVAIKELLFRRMESWKSEELFAREIKTLRELEHPAVPRLIDALEIDDGPRSGIYLVRELVPGRSLDAEMDGRPVDPRDAARIAAELLDAVAGLHALSPPIVHRDLTLSNVLRRDDARLMLVDLGAVKDTLAAAGGGSTLVGTYGYVAPEQLRGAASPASDVYAIAAITTALLAGKPAHALLDTRHRLRMREHARGAMRALLERMLAPEPRTRPSARSAARSMREIASGSPMSEGRAVLTTFGVLLLVAGTSWAALSGSASHGPHTPPETARPIADGVVPLVAPGRPPFPAAFVIPGPGRGATAPTPEAHPRSTPVPPEDWTPACEANGECAPVAASFAGMVLDEECTSLLPVGDAPSGSHAVRGIDRTIAGLVFSCVPTQQHGAFCNVVCTLASSDGWRGADVLVRAIGDLHGRPARYDEVTTSSEPGHYTRQRSWSWRAADASVFGPEVLLLANRGFVEPAQHDTGQVEAITISYRGPFTRVAAR